MQNFSAILPISKESQSVSNEELIGRKWVFCRCLKGRYNTNFPVYHEFGKAPQTCKFLLYKEKETDIIHFTIAALSSKQIGAFKSFPNTSEGFSKIFESFRRNLFKIFQKFRTLLNFHKLVFKASAKRFSIILNIYIYLELLSWDAFVSVFK